MITPTLVVYSRCRSLIKLGPSVGMWMSQSTLFVYYFSPYYLIIIDQSEGVGMEKLTFAVIKSCSMPYDCICHDRLAA